MINILTLPDDPPLDLVAALVNDLSDVGLIQRGSDWFLIIEGRDHLAYRRRRGITEVEYLVQAKAIKELQEHVLSRKRMPLLEIEDDLIEPCPLDRIEADFEASCAGGILTNGWVHDPVATEKLGPLRKWRSRIPIHQRRIDDQGHVLAGLRSHGGSAVLCSLESCPPPVVSIVPASSSVLNSGKMSKAPA